MENKVKLSISVMAHTSREAWFPYLREKLGDVPIAVDTNARGTWDTCRRAWLLHDPISDYHCVIQDDGIICSNFRERAERFIVQMTVNAIVPKMSVFSFYFGNRGIYKTLADKGLKDGFAVMSGIHWGVALCLPTQLIKPMIAFCDKLSIPQDDMRIGRFIRSLHMKAVLPVPSLVDHRKGKSLVGDPGNERSAFYFVGE